MGVSPVWGREMNRKEEAEALLVEILQRGFSAGPHVELFIDIPEMGADSFGAKEELLCNFFVLKSLGNVRKNLGLALRQVFRLPG